MILLDHHIVPSLDRDNSARWLTHVLGLPAARNEGPFAAVDMGSATSLFFAGWHQDVASQHYAFSANPHEFERIVDRLVNGNIEHWADHTASQPSTVRRDPSGSGVYFRSPDGHMLEVLTRHVGAHRPRSGSASP